MLIPFVIFLVVLVTILAGYYLAVQRPEDQAREVIVRRLERNDPGVRRERLGSLLQGTDGLTEFPLLDKLVVPLRWLSTPLARNLALAEMKMTVGALLVTSGIIALVALVVAWALTGSLLLALPIALILSALPFVFVRVKATQRIRLFEDQFPEAIDLMARALRAGHAFPTALMMAADESPQPVGGEFRRLYDQQNFGMPFPDAMREFAGRLPLLDAKFFVTAVLTQRESGGNLAEILDNLARVIRERFKVKRQIRVTSAHGKMTGGVLMALPPFLALCFMVINPGHLRIMLNDPLGVWMIAAAICLQVTGMLVIRSLIDIEY